MNQDQFNVLSLVSAMCEGAASRFSYVDKDGVISLRYVVPLSLDRCKNDAVILRAYDLHRKAPRSFRLDRIMQIIPDR